MNAQNPPDSKYLTDLKWQHKDPFQIESHMIRNGGYVTVGGKRYGNGLAYHYRMAITALWPDFYWHHWSIALISSYAEEVATGVMGPASSGKTYCSAAFALCTYWVWRTGTSIIMSTTTREGLQLRVWGATKKLFNKAKKRRPYLWGRIIESRYMLCAPDPDEEIEDAAADFRDGIIGVACKVGGEFVGISNYVGLKNSRVILIADEASLMERGFFDSISNLKKNPSFKCIIMGNPKDRGDCLGLACEPLPENGGWDGLNQEEKTMCWRTRMGGIAWQLCGTDSPNSHLQPGQALYEGIITPKQIQEDLEYYGRDSLQFTMMNLGIMPKDGGVRRVITAQFCRANSAYEDPVWEGSTPLKDIIALDAAYSGVGGDRCAFYHMKMGILVTGEQALAQYHKDIVPVKQGKNEESPENQIARWVMAYAVLNGIPPEQFGFDSTGRGSLASALARIWSPQVHAIEFGGLPSSERRVRADSPQMESEAYGKKVTALWWASRLTIESKQFRGITDDVVTDGSVREWVITKSGKVDVEPKEKTKERMGRSPDLWDSLATAIEVARLNGFTIAAGKAVGVVTKKTRNWLDDARKKREELRRSYSLET